MRKRFGRQKFEAIFAKGSGGGWASVIEEEGWRRPFKFMGPIEYQKPPRPKQTKITCEIEEIQLENEAGWMVASVCAHCSRCEHITESYGYAEPSIRRCLVLMREQCPMNENNFYVHERASGMTKSGNGDGSVTLAGTGVVSDIAVARGQKGLKRPFPAALKPNEVVYNGYRFRSRLKARWAVFFDAVGIEWQYEPESYWLSKPFLPDFWLPKLEMFAEIKSTREEGDQSFPIVKELVAQSNKRAIVICGSPHQYQSHDVSLLKPDRSYAERTIWQRCILCTRITVDCNCATPSVEICSRHTPVTGTGGRVFHALGEAQRARFEGGENGRPRPYPYSEYFSSDVDVYVAGSVIQTDDDKNEYHESHMLRWRCDVFKENDIAKFYPRHHKLCDGRFRYAGPTILQDHGRTMESLARDCITEVCQSTAVFVWIDRVDTIGTIAEVGAASAFRKQIFIAFATKELSEQFYFLNQLATVALITPDVTAAWKYFKNWQDQQWNWVASLSESDARRARGS